MRRQDLPLLLFTILVQAAVGCFITTCAIARVAFRAYPGALPSPFVLVSSVAILILLIAAFVIASRHLSRPSKGFLAVRNVASSWLSREVVLAILFGACVVGFIGSRLIGTPMLEDAIAALGSLCGLLLVYAISRLYMLRTVPAWNTPATPMEFFATTLITGTALIGSALLWSGLDNGAVLDEGVLDRELPISNMIESLGLLLVALAAIQVLALRIRTVQLNRMPKLRSVADVKQPVTIRILVSAIGAILFGSVGLGLFGPLDGNSGPLLVLTAGTLLVLIGELLGRYIFFALYERAGL